MIWFVMIILLVIILNVIGNMNYRSHEDKESSEEFERQCNRYDPPEAYVDGESAMKIRRDWRRKYDNHGDIDH